MTKYALGTWEMHLQTGSERYNNLKTLESICTYIDTAIDYNNDYLLTDISKYKLISKISSYHTDNYEYFVSNHLKCLGKSHIDIMLIHSNRGEWKKLLKKMVKDTRFKEIGVSNFTIDDIEDYRKIVGNYPAYNEIEINPYYTDIDTIKFCKDNNIKIISYGILGGKYNAIKNVAHFSLPYLLGYAKYYSDIVIIKPECDRHLVEFIDVIKYFKYNYVKFDYKPIVTQSSLEGDNKSIVPMRYNGLSIPRKFKGVPTYNNACGDNADKIQFFKIEKLPTDDIPVFEMLGDYLTYIRYKYKKSGNYKIVNDESLMGVYCYDYLIGDDDCLYNIYIEDEEGKSTKINTLKNNKNVSIYKLSKNK